MKKAILSLLAVGAIFASSCQKQTTLPATGLPQEFSYLEGNWRVVKYYHDTGNGVDTTRPPVFNKMTFTQKRISLSLNDAKVISNQKFHLGKEKDLYLLSLVKNDQSFLLSHYIDFRNDTLFLSKTIWDAGTDYQLVKE